MLTLLRDLRRLRRAIGLERPDRGRSLAVRHVDAGSCNGCEHELILVSSPYTDLQRFGIGVVASPRHADVLLVTGSRDDQDARAAPGRLRRDARAAARGRTRGLRARVRSRHPDLTRTTLLAWRWHGPSRLRARIRETTEAGSTRVRPSKPQFCLKLRSTASRGGRRAQTVAGSF